jgi:Flp pilus assembly pilin Flp
MMIDPRALNALDDSGGPSTLMGRIARDARGAAATEYVVVIAFVGVTTALAIAGVLPRVAEHYANQRALLYQPYP